MSGGRTDEGGAQHSARESRSEGAFSNGSVNSPVSVPLLRWPAERERADRLEVEGLPFLLLVGEKDPPPISGYRFMDWVRSPVDRDELVTRRSNLEDRFLLAPGGARPHLDEETRRLAFGRKVVNAAPSQVAALRTFVDAYRELLPSDVVRAALGPPGAENDNVFRTRLVRLRRTTHAVGLDVKRVRSLGYVLEPKPPDPSGL